MRLMGIDFGAKRVGVALSDETEHFAYPFTVLKNSEQLIHDVTKICEKERVGKIILGRSLDFKMRPNKVMKDIGEFKNELEVASGLPVDYEDEFMTSAEAERLQGRGDKIDASAAALILKSYIDKGNH
ncbi:MAG: Holliday junction resolvase RuvX [Candidatus Vogelbacteria bacterium]|nr:Holliday junction resolvase RuvX [Candidatus Vogelbacteria bacterium]